jgi:hypothetical protein
MKCVVVPQVTFNRAIEELRKAAKRATPYAEPGAAAHNLNVEMHESFRNLMNLAIDKLQETVEDCNV